MAKNRIGKFFTDKKYRPWLIGGVVIIGAIILFSLLGRGGRSQAATGGPAGPSEEAQIAMAQINAQLMATQLASQSEVAQASISAEVANRQTEAALAAAQLQANADVFATEQASILEQQRVAANREVELASLTEATRREELYAQTAIQTAAITAESQMFFAQQAAATQQAFVTADIQKEAIRAQSDVAQANIAADMQRAYFESQADIAREQEATTRLAISRAKRKHVASIVGGQPGQSIGSQIGGVLGGIGSFFSDWGGKEDIKWSGVKDGYNWYTYNEKGVLGIGGGKRHGVMAQEMGNSMYVNKAHGMLMVNYAEMDRGAPMIYQEAV